MKDDSLQGILFSKSEVLRFRKVPVPPKVLVVKTKNNTKKRMLEPLAFMRKYLSKNRVKDTEIVDYADYFAAD